MRQIYVYDHDAHKIVSRGTRQIDLEPRYRGKTINIIPDMEPVQSIIDGTILGTRSDIREHEKRHNVRAVGNDFNGLKPGAERKYEYTKIERTD